LSRSPSSAAEIRRDLLWIVVGAAILLTVFLGGRDLWNPNEPLYGRAVVEMEQRGDWLVPTVNGLTFDEKPILYYWLALVVAKLTGVVNEATLRLPAALAGIAATLLVYLLALPFAGRNRARLSAALFVTSYVVFWESRTVQMDILVTLACLGAVLAVTRVALRLWPPWAGWVVAGAAAGFGFLAKGPVAVICPALAVFLWLVWTRRWELLRPGALALGALAFVAVAAPWFVWLWAAGESDFVIEVLYRQNFTRFSDPWDHQNPWWYFLIHFWSDFAPWAFFVPLAIRPRGRDDDEQDLERLCWAWVAGLIVFFSLSASKRSVYIMPAAPAVAILAAGVAERFLDGTMERWRANVLRCILAAVALILLAGGLYLGAIAIDDYPLVAESGRALALLMVGVGAATLIALILMRRVRAAAPAALLAGVTCIYLLAGARVLPDVNVYKSARPFCERVNAEAGPAAPLASYKQWKWRASYVYYADRRIASIDSAASLREYWTGDRRVFLIVEEERLNEIQSLLVGAEPLFGRRVGSREVYLFSNR